MGPYLDPREEVVMRRVPVLVLVMLVSLASIIAFGRAAPTRAQQATPIAASQSPLIGTWQLEILEVFHLEISRGLGPTPADVDRNHGVSIAMGQK